MTIIILDTSFSAFWVDSDSACWAATWKQESKRGPSITVDQLIGWRSLFDFYSQLEEHPVTESRRRWWCWAALWSRSQSGSISRRCSWTPRCEYTSQVHRSSLDLQGCTWKQHGWCVKCQLSVESLWRLCVTHLLQPKKGGLEQQIPINQVKATAPRAWLLVNLKAPKGLQMIRYLSKDKTAKDQAVTSPAVARGG